MSTTPKRTTRGAPRPSITEDDIQGQLGIADSIMRPKPESPIFESSSGSSHNDDAKDLTYPLPILPISAIQVFDIDNELSLTRSQNDLLHTAMRDSMRDHGVLGSLDFRNRVGAERALKPVLKDVRGRLPFLERIARRKEGPGMERLGELLSARARLVEGSVYRRAIKLHKDIGQAAEPVAEEARVNEDATHVNDASDAAALDGLGVHDQPATNPIPARTPVNVRVRAQATQPFCPTSPIVRVEDSTNGAAVLTTQLLAATQSDTPTVEALRLDRFLELVSEQVGFNVSGRIFAVLIKTCSVAAIDSTINVDNQDKWLADLKHWQTWRRKTCEFVVKAEEGEA